MDAFELSAAIKLNANEFNSGLKNAESKFQAFGKKLASTVGKAVAGATAAVSAAAVAMTKTAVQAYARNEQLIGGVETLYRTSADKVKKYAEQAYRTAGISANKYMEISTSFAASLVSSLGGDTAQAAELANMAIVDMSDNANKMGTDLTAIQNAYQGFAKQNYTMLDNLKLGYGGTKTEMERLLKTAGELDKTTYDISKYADIVRAIHTIQSQETMMISGTTRDEAEKTIEGSMNMFKAAWEDMLVAMSTPVEETDVAIRGIQEDWQSLGKTVTNSKVNVAIKRLADSAKLMLQNMLPTIRNFISGFGDFVSEIAPIIGEEVPQLLADFVPQFINAGKNLIVGLGKGIMKAAEKIKWPTWKDVGSAIGKAWSGIQKGVEALGGLIFGKNVDGSVKWPTWQDVGNAITAAWNGIVKGVEGLAKIVFGENVDGSIDWPTWEEIGSAVTTAWNTIKESVAGLAKIIFGENADGTIKWPTWEEIGAELTSAWNTIVTNVEGLAKIVFGENVDGTIKYPTWNDVGTAITSAWNYIKEQVGNLAKIVFGTNVDGSIKWPTWDDVGAAITSAWNTIKSNVSNLAKIVFGENVDGSINWPKWSTIKNTMEAYWGYICGEAAKLKGLVLGDAADAGSVFDKIKQSWETLKSTIENGAINIATYFFDEANPDDVTAAVKALGDALLVVSSAIAGYTFATKLSQVLETIKGFLTLDIGANKAGLVLAGIAAAFTLIYENWDVIQPKLQAIGEWFTQYVINPVKEAIDVIKEFFGIGKEGDAAPLTGAGKLGGIAANTLINMYEDINEMGGDEESKKGFINRLTTDMQNAEYSAGEIEEAVQAISDHEDPAWVAKFISNLVETNGVAEAIKKTIDEISGDHKATITLEVKQSGGRTRYISGTANDDWAKVTDAEGNAKGNWAVPYDNYPALLHRNEMVLTASQANKLRNGGMNNFDSAAIAEAVRGAVMDLTMELNNETVGRVFGNATTRRVRNNISQINRRHQYGYGG